MYRVNGRSKNSNTAVADIRFLLAEDAKRVQCVSCQYMFAVESMSVVGEKDGSLQVLCGDCLETVHPKDIDEPREE